MLASPDSPGVEDVGDVPQTAEKRNRLVPSSWRGNGVLASRAIDYVWPWDYKAYPGLRRGVLLTLGRTITREGWQHWTHGRRTLPAWAAEALANEIEARAKAGIEIAAELRAHAADASNRLRHQPGRLKGRPTDD